MTSSTKITGVLLLSLWTPALIAAETAPASQPASETSLKDETDKINYSLGFQYGSDLSRQGVEARQDILIRGLMDAISGAQPQISQEQMRSILLDLRRKLAMEQQAKRAKELQQRAEEGRAYLAENAGKAGVVSLPSGLQYKIIKDGTGKSPGSQDSVSVHYRGTLINGTEFDSSYKREQPASFRLDGVIKGWTEGLQLMKEGAQWQFFIPPELAYGERGNLANQTLIFEVELLKVN